MTDPAIVERNFSRGSSSYDQDAGFQSLSAIAMRRFIAGRLPEGLRNAVSDIVEFGCGTGLLTESLTELFPSASIVASDISGAMLDSCRKKLLNVYGHERVSLVRHDFNNPPQFRRRFDVAVSSLAFQWGDDLGAVIPNAASCLKEGGRLLFSIPLDGSLAELRRIFEEEGVEFPGLNLPSRESLDRMLSKFFQSCEIVGERFCVESGIPLKGLLKKLQRTGTVNASGRGIPFRALRGLLERRGSDLLPESYDAAFCHCSLGEGRS